MHQNGSGRTREERVQQVRDEEPSVRDFWTYVPISQAAEKLRAWASQGAEINYLSALTENKLARGDELVGKDDLKADEALLERHAFPRGKIFHREPDERYVDVVERTSPLPDILIEDDCESVGGAIEMTITYLRPEIKAKIKSIVVPEFGGIDHLPDRIEDLK